METLRSYLNSMFFNLPETEELRRAKEELGQMMEDKYNELRKEGKAEHEAVGIVISEFGNVDEVLEELGIHLNPTANPMGEAQMEQKYLSEEQVETCEKEIHRQAGCIAIGVLLCIVSPTAPILGTFWDEYFNRGEGIMENLGAVGLFLLAAIAVGFFIMGGTMNRTWKRSVAEGFQLSPLQYRTLREKYEKRRMASALYLSIGCALCILCVIPPIIFDYAFDEVYWDELGAIGLFLVCGVGVAVIVWNALEDSGLKNMLRTQGTVSQIPWVEPKPRKVTYASPVATSIMSVYWTTVTCLYLIVSFLSFEWGITWVIWPLAAVIHNLLENALPKKEEMY